MIGPTTRDPLIIAEFSETEPAMSSRSTNVGSMADHAGAFSALPMPTPSATRKMAQIGASAAANGASNAENASCSNCIAMSHLRRSNRSAITPAGMDKKSSGPSWAKTIRPTIDALSVRSSTYSGSTTFCIHVPMLDENEAIHMRRKSGYASAARALPGRCPWERGALGVLVILTGGSRLERPVPA